MLLLSAKLIGQPILSLRTGSEVAVAHAPMINPDSLKVLGFYCYDKFSGDELVLLAQDIREHIARGFVVNDHEVLASPEDLVRLGEVMDRRFDPIGKQVVTNHKRVLGKVCDYAVDNQSLIITKLYVTPPLLKSLLGSNLSIDRRQIIEVTDKQIIVREATSEATSKAGREAKPAPAAA